MWALCQWRLWSFSHRHLIQQVYPLKITQAFQGILKKLKYYSHVGIQLSFTKSSLCTVWHLCIHDDPSKWCSKTIKKIKKTKRKQQWQESVTGWFMLWDQSQEDKSGMLLVVFWTCKSIFNDEASNWYLRTKFWMVWGHFAWLVAVLLLGLVAFAWLRDALKLFLNHPSILWY